MKTKNKNKRKASRVLGWILVGVCLTSLVGIFSARVWIKHSFEETLPENFFSMNIIGKSPQFYVYQFTDRKNRVGTAEEFTDTGFESMPNLYVKYEEIPQSVINAFVAIEDKRFYRHNGVDFFSSRSS